MRYSIEQTRVRFSDWLTELEVGATQQRAAIVVQLAALAGLIIMVPSAPKSLTAGVSFTAFGVATVVGVWRIVVRIGQHAPRGPLDDVSAGVATAAAISIIATDQPTPAMVLIGLSPVVAAAVVATRPALQPFLQAVALSAAALLVWVSLPDAPISFMVVAILTAVAGLGWTFTAIVAKRADRQGRLNHLFIRIQQTADPHAAVQEIVDEAERLGFDGAFLKIIDSARHLQDFAASPSVDSSGNWGD